jgi:hypothetical protein
MKKIHSFCCLLLLAVSFSSCNPNDDSNNNAGPNDDAFAQNFGSTVARDFIGQVVDIDNAPIQGVTIKIGTTTVQTDVNGVFIINGANVYQKFANITAKKVGYIEGSRAMVPTSGKNNVKIMLLPNAPLETIQSGVVSEVSIYSGTKVKFQGGFQDENGTNYTGPVQVSMFHLTPTDENISKLMPGMLYAQTSTNQEAVLETFGMLNLELRGSAGQKLNIKEGQTGEITIRIDDSQIATAPSSIPLWHFDEERGYWKQEGVATKVGNKYVGEVSHFSWWNYDVSFPSVYLTVTVVDSNGNPLSNINVMLTRQLSPAYSQGEAAFTDNNGQVSGFVPVNVSLSLNIFASSFTCVPSNIIYTTTIGPFTSNTILPTIVVGNITSVSSSNVFGTIVKCDNNPVTNGYVILKKYGISSIFPITNGNFNFNDIYCTDINQFTLQGFDYDNQLETGIINYTFTSPSTPVGNIIACLSYNEFITYQIDNNPTVFLIQNVSGGSNTQGGLPSGGLNLYGSSANNQGLAIWGNTNVPGIYTTAQFSIEGAGVGYISSTTTNTIQFNLSQFGVIGDYIDMTFSGTYQDSNGGNHTLTGVAHVIRDN